MNLSFFDRLRPYLSRFVIAPLAVFATNFVAHKTGIVVDPNQVSVAVDLAVYGAAHRVADKIVNPQDTASAHLAVDGKAQVQLLKR